MVPLVWQWTTQPVRQLIDASVRALPKPTYERAKVLKSAADFAAAWPEALHPGPTGRNLLGTNVAGVT